jgi:hypothetical protein
MALNPVLRAAMNDVEESAAGLASGMVNTSFIMGGALGLTILASIAASRSTSLLASGEDQLTALTSGYHTAFLAGALCAAGAAALSAAFVRGGTGSAVGTHGEAAEERLAPVGEATQRPGGCHELPRRTPGEARDAGRTSPTARFTG